MQESRFVRTIQLSRILSLAVSSLAKAVTSIDETSEIKHEALHLVSSTYLRAALDVLDQARH